MQTKLSFVPHGINPDIFCPITESHPDFAEFTKFSEEFKKKHNVKFIVFWNNRNIRRKQPGDVILAFKQFCDTLPKEERQDVCLLMKTQIIDQNGTDLWAVKKNICPNYKILFEESILPPRIMNFFYNLADVTINIGSNEGFGLSNAESIMSGTVTITNVTGGLQDQCRFENEDGTWYNPTAEIPSNHSGRIKKCGSWVIPVFPTNRSLQGSPATPYIFDDRASFEDVALALGKWYALSRDERRALGAKGREWMMSEESGMSSMEMCNRMVRDIDNLLETWTPPTHINLIEVKPKSYTTEIGIV